MKRWFVRFTGGNMADGQAVVINASTQAAANQAAMRYLRSLGVPIEGVQAMVDPNASEAEIDNYVRLGAVSDATRDEERQYGNDANGDGIPDEPDDDYDPTNPEDPDLPPAGTGGDQSRGLEPAGEYEAVFRRGVQARGGGGIEGPGLWNAAQREQFYPAYATFRGLEALSGKDGDDLNAFQKYITENGDKSYAFQAANAFNDINNRTLGGGVGGVDLTDPAVKLKMDAYRNPLGIGTDARGGSDDASGIAANQRTAAGQGFNLGRAGARLKQSAYWDRYVPNADETYTRYLTETGGTPPAAGGDDWFDYLKRKGYA